MIHNIPQPAFEELIAKRLSKSNLVEIRKNHTFVGLEQVGICTHSFPCNGCSLNQFDDHVITAIQDRDSKEVYKVRSRHVVACDGAKSAVRSFLGIKSEGEDSCKYTLPLGFQ